MTIRSAKTALIALAFVGLAGATAAALLLPQASAQVGSTNKVIGFTAEGSYSMVLYQADDGTLTQCTYGRNTGKEHECVPLTKR